VPDSFEALLRDALVVISAEQPERYRRLARTVAPLRLSLTVGAERMGVESSGEMVCVTVDVVDADVRLVTDRRCVLRLLGGACSLEEAVFSEDLRLWGSVDALLLFYDGLVAFLNGAVRSPPMSGLLARYRKGG